MPGRGPEMWRSCSCCGDGAGVVQVDVYGDGTQVGLSGLQQAFEDLYAQGLAPTDPIGDRLLARIKAQNYVPRNADEVYKAALVREYTAFYAKQGRPRVTHQDRPRATADVPKAEVEIFTKAGCPYCSGLKRKLAHDRTPYIEHDVQNDPAALRWMLELNGGRRNVPTIRNGDQVTVGFHGM